MEQIEATSIPNFGLKLKRQGNLLYHEGPLLSHFINEDNPNEHYFYKWTDCDDTCNRWLVFRLSSEGLKSFFEKKSNLLNLIRENPFVYFIDLDNNLSQNNLVICSTDKIPADYLPSENSFFKEEQYEQYAIQLKDSLLKKSNETTVENALVKTLIEEMANIKTSQREQNILLSTISNKLGIQRPNV